MVKPTGGFTLLELMLSLAIAAVMIGALYSLLYQTAWSVEVGNDVAREGQLARALLDRMAADIRASAAGSGTYNAGLKGDATRLTLYTHVVPLDLDFSETSWRTPSAGQGDLVEVTYALRTAGEEETPAGISRRVRRLLGAIRADADSTSTEVLTEEVTGLRFRYSSGGQWLETWDGGAGRGTPKAVEITLTLRKPSPTEEAWAANRDTIFGSEEAAACYRLVVAVPTGAEPEGTIIQRDSTAEEAD